MDIPLKWTHDKLFSLWFCLHYCYCLLLSCSYELELMPCQNGLLLIKGNRKKSEFDKLIAGTDKMQLQISWIKVILSSAIYYLQQDFTGIIIIVLK